VVFLKSSSLDLIFFMGKEEGKMEQLGLDVMQPACSNSRRATSYTASSQKIMAPNPF
jgi:hypothetical protein